MPEPRLVLASSSPRRRELLRLLGIPFLVTSADVDEVPLPGETAATLVTRLSRLKAEAVGPHYPDAIVIAADTDVDLDGEILGKPRDKQEARQMLRALRGREHSVHSVITLANLPHPAFGRSEAQDADWTEMGNNEVTIQAHTRVWMRHYSDSELEAYVESGDPLDKAAGYAVQHARFRPVAQVEGCFANVMGLPLCHLWNALANYCTMPESCLECHLHPGADCTIPRLVAEGTISGS